MSRPALRVAVAASADFAELDASWPLLRRALDGVGISADVAPWDDPATDWAAFDAVVPLYVWGYVTTRAEFLAWISQVAGVTTILNDAAAVAWNSDKRYLADLEADGVPIVPTAWVFPVEQWQMPSDDFVIKPTVGSGGLGAARYAAGDRVASADHVRRLHAAGLTAMVQPYQASVDGAGEAALVFIDGAYSHAVRKGPLLVRGAGETDRLWEREVITSLEPRREQQTVAELAVAVADRRFGSSVYARVDLVDGADGAPLLLELELIEPTLFLLQHPPAATALAAAVRRRLRL